MKKPLEMGLALVIVILMGSIMIFSVHVPSSAIKETSVSPSTATASIGRDMNANGTETVLAVNKTEAVPSTVDPIDSTYAINSSYPDGFDGPYFDVTPAAVHLGAVGQTFTVTIALHNVTVENVPAGIGGAEVHMTWNTSLVQPVNFTDYLGVPGTGALIGPTLYALQGFYDCNGSSCNQLAKATQFDVAEASIGGQPWWSVNSPGIVAVIAFNITSPPSSPSTICSLCLNYIELVDNENNHVPINLMNREMDVSNNLLDGKIIPDDGLIRISCTVQDVDHCVLSYKYDYEAYVSGWTNQNMVKDGNSYTASFDPSFVHSGTNFTYRIVAYDSSGHSSESAVSTFQTTPSVLRVSDSLEEGCMPENGTLISTANVKFADYCVLSYRYTCLGNSSDWINESMTKSGDNYTGTIDANLIPANTEGDAPTFVEYKIVAYDKFGNSVESPVSYFEKFNDGDLFPLILTFTNVTPGDWTPDPVNVTAILVHGDSCVLSYRCLLLGKPITDWINETMTKNGNTYSASFSCSAHAFPCGGEVQWKVSGYDDFGHSFQSLTNEFYYCYDTDSE